MKKFYEIIILSSRGNLKRYKISQFSLNLLKLFLLFVIIILIANFTVFLLNLNTLRILKENLELKSKLAEFKKIENEINEFRKVKKSLYLALGIDKMPKDSILYQTNNPDLVEQIDTPVGLPVSGIITREHSNEHPGIDIALNKNSFVYSTAIGKVEKVDSNEQFGLHILISHNKNYKTLYAHLSKVMVNVGDSVKRGQVIGFSGSSGHSTGPHLHYEVWKENKPINPLILNQHNF
jgi:murein DD-endopeptidase MepM/ murein hydrolase activator NlpD